VRLSALRAGRPLPPGRFLLLITLSRSQGHTAAGRIRSIEKSNDLNGYRTRVVPKPTMLLRDLRIDILQKNVILRIHIIYIYILSFPFMLVMMVMI
jgi:hypothetical protein